MLDEYWTVWSRYGHGGYGGYGNKNERTTVLKVRIQNPFVPFVPFVGEGLYSYKKSIRTIIRMVTNSTVRTESFTISRT